MKHFVEIHAPGSATERHEIVGKEARIGSGNACSIQPKFGKLHAEHLRLVPSGAGCGVHLMPGVAGPLIYAGAPQWEVNVPWGDEVFLDGTRFTFLRERGQTKKPNPVLLAVAAVVLTLTALAFARSSDDEEVSRRELEPPALLEKAATCQEGEPARIEAVAQQAERAALAKEERSGFDVADGAQALALLSVSEACYRLSGKTTDADRLKVELSRWTAQMNEDYAATRLQLRIAIEHRRWREALDAVHHVRSLLTGHGTEPYLDWLAELSRELERRATAN